MQLPPGIKALGPEAEQRIEALVADARRRQQQELVAALENTLKIVPKPLRGVVRKVVGGVSGVPLETRAEQVKLGRTLGVDASELSFLESAPPDDLRALREAIADELFDADRRHFEGIVKLAKRLPTGLAATLARRALGPRLAAGTANILPPDLAEAFIKRLPPDFLADIATHADGRKLAPVIRKVPPDTIAEITRILAGRREYVVMGMLVGHLKPNGLEAAIKALDPESLLRTGFVMENKDPTLDEAQRHFSQERLNEYVLAAADLGLVPELLDSASHLKRRQFRRLASALTAMNDEQLQRWVERVRSEPVLSDLAAPLLEVAPPRVQAAAGIE